MKISYLLYFHAVGAIIPSYIAYSCQYFDLQIKELLKSGFIF